MEGSKHDDLRRQLKEYEAENRGLREQLEQAGSEIDRLRGENEQLRKELKAAGRGPKHGTNSRKRKAPRKRPGRKAGQGPFTFRQSPAMQRRGEGRPSKGAQRSINAPAAGARCGMSGPTRRRSRICRRAHNQK